MPDPGGPVTKMNMLSTLKVSYDAVASNKLRSVLTTLGIIIGVAAVITLVALTQGAKTIIEEQLTNLGGNSLIVNYGKRAGTGIVTKSNIKNPLTAADADAIRNLSIVTFASPIIDTAATVVSGNRNWFTTLVGVSTDFININDWRPEQGSFFNNRDIQSDARVCVIGKTVANKLFGYQNPTGKFVRIGNNSFKVIGVMSPVGQTPSGKDQDDVILMPFTTLQKRIMGISRVENISVSVKNSGDVPLAQTKITQLLRERHKIGPGMVDDFYVKSQLSIIERIFTISKIMTILLGSVASISLIVGGIGIMNIMLVSVRERTREIGIRMAVGAKESDILIQFLVEAVLISIAGGIIGIVIGIAGSKISSSFTGWPGVISLGSILIAFGFAAIVGIFSGIYPARKASKLDPIEALRYE
jgi:putative ABC transport system permease protein